MNALEHLLDDELNRLVDRIAALTRPGTVEAVASQHPELGDRVERAEGRLTELRQSLLARYADWQEAMEDCENLWAVAALESEAPTAQPAGSRRAA